MNLVLGKYTHIRYSYMREYADRYSAFHSSARCSIRHARVD